MHPGVLHGWLSLVLLWALMHFFSQVLCVVCCLCKHSVCTHLKIYVCMRVCVYAFLNECMHVSDGVYACE